MDQKGISKHAQPRDRKLFQKASDAIAAAIALAEQGEEGDEQA